MHRWQRSSTGVAIGAVVTVPLALVAIASAGAGHGNYLAARLLFPFATLMVGGLGHLVPILALPQFPLYGFLIGRAGTRRRALVTFAAIVSVHLAVAVFEHASRERAPEQASLCRITDLHGWTNNGAQNDATIVLGGTHYDFSIFDRGSLDDVHGPVPGVYWIQLSGATLRDSETWPDDAHHPMLYDPSGAVLEMHGQVIHALPRIWVDKLGDIFSPSIEQPVPATFNFRPSADRLHTYFIAFPIHAPGPKDVYRFRPGFVRLEGRNVVLPTFESCFSGSAWWSLVG